MTRRILVLGATGGTGRQVVAQALEAGHTVTAFVRDAQRLAMAHDRLRVMTGDVRNDDQLGTAVRGQEAVLSALGVGNSLRPAGLIAHSAPAIVRAMDAAGVRRLIFTSAYGVGDTRRDVPLVPRLLMRVLLRELYADKQAGDEAIQRSALEWTIVYPSTLTNGPRTGRYRVGERLALRGVPRIARADVAAFLLAQVEDRACIRKGVLISG